jgi:hypothetical protein
MASTQQLERWCASVMAAVANGFNTVDKLIAHRDGKRMSTLVAVKHLCNSGALLRYGNLLYITHQTK